MQPLGTKAYLLKRYSPSDSFCTFFSESARWCSQTTAVPVGLHPFFLFGWSESTRFFDIRHGNSRRQHPSKDFHKAL